MLSLSETAQNMRHNKGQKSPFEFIILILHFGYTLDESNMFVYDIPPASRTIYWVPAGIVDISRLPFLLLTGRCRTKMEAASGSRAIVSLSFCNPAC